jgi:peptidoglycan hydrolase CwlO-like protein
MLDSVFLQTLQISNWSFFLGCSTLLVTLGYAIVRITRSIESKADKDKVVLKDEYTKDIEKINYDFDDFSKDLDDMQKRMDKFDESYHNIDKKLDLLALDIKYIKQNCDRTICKTK